MLASPDRWRRQLHALSQCFRAKWRATILLLYPRSWFEKHLEQNPQAHQLVQKMSALTSPVQVKSIFNSSIRAVRTSWSVKAPEIIRCFRACTASILSSTVPCYPKSIRWGITVFQYNLLTRALMPPKPARSKLNHTFVLYWCSEHSAQSWNTASYVFSPMSLYNSREDVADSFGWDHAKKEWIYIL